MEKNNREIILGTSSKPRLKAMESLGLIFIVEPSDFDETMITANNIDDLVIATAKGKADILVKRFPDSIIITADSNHWFDGKNYGKPETLDQARNWLKMMRGHEQEIHTALVLSCGNLNKQTVDLNISKYSLKNFTDDELGNYLSQVNPTEKATGYTPDGPGLVLLDKFIGEPGANLALPLETLKKRLREFGVEI